MDYEKGIGIYARASALSIGGNFGPIGGRVDIGSIGYTFVFKKGKIEIGASYLIGFSVSVDVIWIIEFLSEELGG